MKHCTGRIRDNGTGRNSMVFLPPDDNDAASVPPLPLMGVVYPADLEDVWSFAVSSTSVRIRNATANECRCWGRSLQEAGYQP